VEGAVAINSGKVVAGGLAAGVVMNVIDFATQNLLFKDPTTAALNALNPALAAGAGATSTIVGFVLLDFVIGLLLIWTYAAIRPRFGPGPWTAVKAALLFWLFGGTTWAMVSLMGIFTWGFFAMNGCAFLVNLLVGAYVGARIYQEE
jgi:hypothetical protein